jgi:hypothetical protein
VTERQVPHASFAAWGTWTTTLRISIHRVGKSAPLFVVIMSGAALSMCPRGFDKEVAEWRRMPFGALLKSYEYLESRIF